MRPVSKLLTTTAIAALALSLPVMAEGLPTRSKGGNIPNVVAPQRVDAPASWTGFVIGIHGGWANTHGELGFGPASIDGLAASGALAGATVGVRLHVPGSALVIGARGGYQWHFGEFQINGGCPGCTFEAGLDRSWFVDGTFGLAYGSALPYLVVGYAQAETKASIGGTSIGGTPDLTGWRVGGGIEMRLPAAMAGYMTPTLSVEYIATFFDTETLGGPGGPTLDVTDHAVLARLNFQIGK